ncbi:MAG: hypothetical protein V7640_799 [Betaproteobacteria bacterium]|jgi:uncharacterized membrane protein
MIIMVAGLVLFIGVHLIPTAPGLRARLVVRLGDKAYRAFFAITAALGLVLIIAGYHMRPERVQLFAPFPAARAAAPLLVTIAFILFAAANMRTHIRSIVRHPMLIGLMLWSGVHLLANGDVTGTILFGSFFAYSIIAIVSAISRRSTKAFVPNWKHDLIAIAAGLAISYLTIRLHPLVFGTGLVG